MHTSIAPRFLVLALALALALPSGLCGCGLVPGETFEDFEPAPAVVSTAPIQRLVIVPLRDARPDGGRSSVGASFLILIPLWPYGPQHLRSYGAIPDASDDLPAVITRDLRAAGLIQDAFEGSVEEAARLPGQVQPHVLALTLHESVWNRNVTLYGLSFAGAFLWFIGAPSSYGSAQLDFTAELLAPDGRSLGRQRFAGEGSVTEMLYISGHFSGGFSDAFTEIAPELRAFVGKATGVSQR